MKLEDLVKFRQKIHQHPELSANEFQTQALILSELRKMGASCVKKVAKTGVLVSFDSEKAGPEVLLRADHDALPIPEINTFSHRSQNEGISHKCGHDGHAAIMMAVANYFQKNPPKKGAVHLLFQPGEEDGYGARAVLADPDFDIQPDFVFALHNLPGYPLHQVVCHEGIFTPAAKSVIFTLKGKTSHAAEPELGLNPDLAVSEILQLRKELSQPDSERDDFRLITTVHLTLGEKSYGVSAGYAEVHLTLRSWENGVMDDLQKELITKTKAICNQYKIKLEEEWLEEFSSNKNDHQSFEIIKEAAAAENLHFLDKNSGFKWGEDFGLFTDQFSGAMFGLGAGKDHPALHNPDYDFPDELIESGQRMFTSIVKQLIQ